MSGVALLGLSGGEGRKQKTSIYALLPYPLHLGRISVWTSFYASLVHLGRRFYIGHGEYDSILVMVNMFLKLSHFTPCSQQMLTCIPMTIVSDRHIRFTSFLANSLEKNGYNRSNFLSLTIHKLRFKLN